MTRQMFSSAIPPKPVRLVTPGELMEAAVAGSWAVRRWRCNATGRTTFPEGFRETRGGRRVIDSTSTYLEAPAQCATMERRALLSPTGGFGSVPWMEVDRLVPDYNARVGGPAWKGCPDRVQRGP